MCGWIAPPMQLHTNEKLCNPRKLLADPVLLLASTAVVNWSVKALWNMIEPEPVQNISNVTFQSSGLPFLRESTVDLQDMSNQQNVGMLPGASENNTAAISGCTRVHPYNPDGKLNRMEKLVNKFIWNRIVMTPDNRMSRWQTVDSQSLRQIWFWAHNKTGTQGNQEGTHATIFKEKLKNLQQIVVPIIF